MSEPVLRGPRPRFFICVAKATSDQKKLHPTGIILSAELAETKEMALESFKATHGVDAAEVLDGKGTGFYIAQGTGQGEIQRISVTVSAKDLVSRTPKSFSGEFKGWKVLASGLRACSVEGVSYKDNELLSIEFDSLADANNKVPKPKLKKREVIPHSMISNLTEC